MDLQELKQKMNKETQALIRYDSKGNPYVSMPVGKIPLSQFKEFNTFVEREYSGNRWLAIWTLYMRNKQFDLQAEVEYLKQQESEESDTKESNSLGLLIGDNEDEYN